MVPVVPIRRTPLRGLLRLLPGVLVCLAAYGARLAGAAPVDEWVDLRVQIVAAPPLDKVLANNLDIVRWSTRGPLTRGQLEQLYATASAQARELAATEGYFSAHVQATLEQEAGVYVARFEVQPGAPARVASVDLSVTGAVTQDPESAKRIERARRALRLKQGDIFRQADWSAAKERVVRSLARVRYATAQVAQSRAEIDPDARTAALHLVVDSGPPVTMGTPRVAGLRRYSPKLVLDLNPIPPGSPYDEDALLKYQRRLQLSGYFTSAVVRATPQPEVPDNTAILVTVVESPARRVEAGVGYSTDRGARAQIRYSDNNIGGRAWKFSSELYADHLVQRGSLGLAFPRQPSGWHYALEGKLEAQDIQNQDVHYWSVAAARIYVVEEYESALSLEYLREISELPDGTRDFPNALFVNQRWLWNTLDDPINPRRGYTFQVQLGGAAQPLLSTQTFGRVHLRGNYLKPLTRTLTLSLRGELGLVLADSRQGIPSNYVFRTGGDTSIRGYEFDSLGVAQGGAIVGGRYLLVGSVELIHWITREWGAAIFADGGNAWDDLGAFDPVFGYGGGVRWRSPVGHLSLDLAWAEQRHQLRLAFSAGILFR